MLPRIFLWFSVICFWNFRYGFGQNAHLFPDNFLFGVSTSAYQTEGAWNQDGKGESIWDTYTHSANSSVAGKANGDIACDSYNRFQNDLDNIRYLNVSMYRFSIPWTRILPNGTGSEPNEISMKHYTTMVTVLHYIRIEPVVVLYHFDLPAALEKQGGLLSNSFPEWFANYARICFRELGPFVKYWITFNEPTTFCNLNSAEKDYLCVHNILKAHAAAYHIYDKEFRKLYKGKVSMIHAISYAGPKSETAKDKEAAEWQMQFDVGWVAQPLYHGDYPSIMKTRITNRSKLEGYTKSRLPEFTEEEKKLIKGTSDFFALNTFWSYVVVAIDEPKIIKPPNRQNDVGVGNAGGKVNTLSGAWGIKNLMNWIRKQYNDPEILITGNGMATDGMVDDLRSLYITDYLSAIRDSMIQGAKVFGYSFSNLMDSFEWNDGYTMKMGLYSVDFDSPNRTRELKKSGTFYKKVTSTHCLVRWCRR